MASSIFDLPRRTEARPEWPARSLRSILKPRSERNRPDLPLLTVARERGVFVRTADDDNHNVIPEDLSNYKVARRGDLVINKMKAWQGSLGLAPVDGIVSPAYFVFHADFAVPQFGEYLLRSKPYVAKFGAASDGVRVGQWDLNIPRMRDIPVALPSVEEQAAIVKYLAHANARIDKAIAAKRRLLRLLDDERGAIQFDVVTGAQEASRRQTSSRWFPDLPSSWDVVPLRRLIQFAIDGPHFSPAYVDDGYPFLSARNIRADRWLLDDVKYVSRSDFDEFNRRVQPLAGDVLYTKGGTTGVARVVDLSFPFQIWVHVAVLRLRTSLVDPNYLAMALNSRPCYEQSQLETRGATNQDLGLSRMKRIELPLPPLLDQRRLVEELADRTRDIAKLVERATREIELLQEFRTSLVADVVTGKVDVRELAKSLGRDRGAGGGSVR